MAGLQPSRRWRGMGRSGWGCARRRRSADFRYGSYRSPKCTDFRADPGALPVQIGFKCGAWCIRLPPQNLSASVLCAQHFQCKTLKVQVSPPHFKCQCKLGQHTGGSVPVLHLHYVCYGSSVVASQSIRIVTTKQRSIPPTIRRITRELSILTDVITSLGSW